MRFKRRNLTVVLRDSKDSVDSSTTLMTTRFSDVVEAVGVFTFIFLNADDAICIYGIIYFTSH